MTACIVSAWWKSTTALVLMAAAVTSTRCAAADGLRLPSIFSPGMVVQRGMPVRVWGWADPGASVQVAAAGQHGTAVSDATGRWEVVLPALASGAPTTLEVHSGPHTQTVPDVLVGEVILCSGQSNMAMSLDACRRAPGVGTVIASTTLPEVRFFQTPNATFAEQPQDDVAGQWVAVAPATNPRLSAVAFAAAVALHRTLGCPIGVIRASHGGGAAEIKMPLDALLSVPAGQRFFADASKRADPAAVAERQRLVQQRYAQAVADAQAIGAQPPVPPQPARAIDGGYPCADWNGVIAPVIRYSKRAVIWYQGEHNAARAGDYADILTALIGGWRRASGQDDLPFVLIQLPAFASPSRADDWPRLREAQARVAHDVSRTTLVVTIDHGERDNIHPADKLEIGQRAAAGVLALCFAAPGPLNGPTPTAFTTMGQRLIVQFPPTHPLGGTDSEELTGFLIAGADRRFLPAHAIRRGDTVEVDHALVPQPLAVRYAWDGFPRVSLRDAAGRPVAPFRSDDWE